MLTWYEKTESKIACTNLTWLYFAFPNSFVFPYFKSNIFSCLFVWYSMVSGIDLFSNILFQTFVYFTVLTYYISNLDSVKVAQSQIL